MATWIRVLIGAGIGLLAGGALGYLAKCTSGTCPLTASPLRTAIFGTIIGVVLSLSMSATSRRTKNSNHIE